MSDTAPPTDRWGIDAAYENAGGDQVHVPEATIDAFRALIGEAPTDAPVLVRRPGATGMGRGTVVLEDGGEVSIDGNLPADLPLGYHTLRTGDAERRLIVSPGRCHLPEGWRAWGWAAQLYATRSRDSWGMGDLADLARLGRWSTDELGAGFVLINPIHATAPTLPQQPSPYSPTSRRFRNPIYLHVEDVPGAAALLGAGGELDALATAGRALDGDPRIDRDAVWRLKLAALALIWDGGHWADRAPEAAAFATWRRDRGGALEQFATWSVLAEAHGGSWRSWPAALRAPHDPAVAAFAGEHAERIAFHAWLQWLLDVQLAAAGATVPLMVDLPIGVDPDGADAWAWQDLFADGVSVGAPPDEFNTRGQDWGLPPFIPWKLRHAGYQPFVDALRATVSPGGGLRIDHVMGLFRLWWVPAGQDPGQGAFVRYPGDDLLDIVALESHRAGAVVVGEDLGTVEASARAALRERALLSYRLLWFEPDEPEDWPVEAMAAVTTHDLPTVAGLWDGSDLATQHELGLQPNEAGTIEIRQRLADRAGLSAEAAEHTTDEQAVLAAHRVLGRSPCTLLSATLDDALAVAERPNLPGADGQRANWCLALPATLDDLETSPLAAEVARVLRAAVAPPSTVQPPEIETTDPQRSSTR